MGGPGSGSKPREYLTDIVEEACWLYCAGYTIAEVQERIGRGYKVQTILNRHLVGLRKAAKRDQRGPANHMWKGADATYQAFHHRLTNLHGQPSECSVCGTTDPTKTYDWANLTGNYPDVNDYARMCRSCHRRYDQRRREEVIANA